MALGDDNHYEAQVITVGLNMRTFTAMLNTRWKDGWKLYQLFSVKQGETVIVWERSE